MDILTHDNAALLLDAARKLEPLVASLRGRFDHERRLPDDLVEAIGDAGLFGMWLPRALGGPELPPLPPEFSGSLLVQPATSAPALSRATVA